MPYYGDALPYYYGGPFSNHSSLMTGTGRTLHSPLGTSRYAPHLTTISESPLSALRRYASPASTMTSRPKRVIDTADIDVSTPRALTHTSNNNNNNHHQRNRLRRDRPTIRIRSQALKDNPALREHYERHEKTVGELLVEKFLIKEKKPEVEEGEFRTKLYTQVSLENELTKKQDEELQEAIQRRVTRRMTRRRSSADVQMDPEQLEREVMFAQAQADALDTLVAQEQAEIEVETRMGTLLRKNLVRSSVMAPCVRSKNDNQGISGDDDDETRIKKLAKKMKKRKKMTDKPSPPNGSELDSEKDETRTKKVQKDNKEIREKSCNIDKNGTIINGDDETLQSHTENEDNENCPETPMSPSKALKFKVEASNSVGDFSTLWINANVTEEQETQRKKSQDIVEQFRDSVRLPAPKQMAEKMGKVNKKKDMIVEEHQEIVVLPVKKRYVKDDTRNSVYLTLKTQKSANDAKMDDVDETSDRIVTIDNNFDQSTSLQSKLTNGKTIDEEITTKNDTTTSITRQPSRVNKVAKFRSKDIIESDIEVKSISELMGDETSKGKIGTNKDVSLQNLSASRDPIAANSSISVSPKRDVIEIANIVNVEDPSNDEITTKNDKFIKNEEIVKPRDTEDFFNIENSSFIKVSSLNDDKSVTKDENIEESAGKSAIEEKVEKKLKPIKKETKNLRKNDNKLIGDELRKVKTSVGNSLDSSREDVENLEIRKIDEKEKRKCDDANSSSTTRISSSDTPCSNIVESLPNASRINYDDIENNFNDVKIHDEKFNVTRIENEKITENFSVKENLSLSGKITGKSIESRGVKSKLIGVTSDDNEVDTLENSLRDKNESENILDEETNVNFSKILTTTKTDVNATKFEADNDDKILEKLKIKVAQSSVETKNDDENFLDLPKLRKNDKILPLSPSIDNTKIVHVSSNSADLEIAFDNTKKIQTGITKKSIEVTKNGDDILQRNIEKSLNSKIEKSLKDSKGDKAEIEEKITNDKEIESVPSTFELAKLTNGRAKKKPKTILAIKEISKPEVTLKTTKKPQVQSAKKEEEIDFWGEIASQRVSTKPSKKMALKIIEKKENINDNLVSEDKTEKDNIIESMVVVLEPEAKSNTSLKIGTREEAKNVIGGEKKSNKVKRKKTNESISECKKKDEEKASSETIFEHFTSSDLVEEKSQKQPEQLEQQSEKLAEKNFDKESCEEKICDNLDDERFERNLSTIVEENLSPILEKVPKRINDIDLVNSSLRNSQENLKTKLGPAEDLSLLAGDVSESEEKTATKEKVSSVQSEFDEPEVIVTNEPENKNQVGTFLLILPETRPFIGPNSSICERSLPIIEIVVAPEIPSELESPAKTIIPEGEIAEDDAEEGPGTPTNETVHKVTSNITKWNGLDDLSLDEPDKDIGPEVAAAAAEAAKKETSKKKKKIGSSKKVSKKKNSVSSNSPPGASPDSSKKKKLGKRKKSSTKNVKDNNEERSGSKISNSSDTTLKPTGLNLRLSPKNSGRNSPKQRPLDLIKMFYTTPASLLTATPRDLSKVRRAKIKKRKHSTRTASASSDSTGSTRSTQSTGTAESTGSTEHEDDAEQKRISSTRSNDSGFDGSPRLSNCDMACHKKCEKLTGNLCGLNQKLVAEALQALKRAPSQSSDNQRNSDGSDHHASGRVTPPATNLPRFKKYTVMDFNFLKVLGKGSFGKVLLAELRRTDCVYAVKCLKKDVVLEDDDVECTLIERKVLTLATRHPYLCHLFCTFQTDSHLFFVMEYLNGGDLMFHIQKSGRFAESRARFYAGEIWSGLNFLHKKGIVYRDLKLDNVLLDFEGHIRIADFGMCKLQIFLDRTADTFCGTPDYMAPEIIKGLKYNQAVDWWSFGVLLYEMLTGQSPFSGCDEDELFWSICNERPFIPRYLSQEAMDVLVCLLEKDAGKRPVGHEIAVHPFFLSLQWDRLERRQLEPPFKPALEHTLDTRYFDTAFTAERPRLTPVPEQILTSMDQGVFRGFSYTNPNATD